MNLQSLAWLYYHHCRAVATVLFNRMLKASYALICNAKHFKKSIKNGLAWVSSLAASAQCLEKAFARVLISFHESGMF